MSLQGDHKPHKDKRGTVDFDAKALEQQYASCGQS